MSIAIAGLSPPEVAWCGLVLFIAAYVRGYSGFGFSAVLMAGMSLVLPPAQIVPLSISLEVLASVQQGVGVRRQVAWRPLIVLLLAGFVGTPLGVMLLVIAPERLLTFAVLLFIAAASVILVFARPKRQGLNLPVLAGAGLFAGIVNGATALSGLVLALAFSLTSLPAATMRATLIAYFFGTDLWAGIILWLGGVLDHVTIARALISLPIMILGLWMGGRRFLGASQEQFRAVVLWLLLALCLLGIVRLAVT